MPEDKRICFFVRAIASSIGRLVTSPDGILNRSTPTSSSNATASMENGDEMNSIFRSSACALMAFHCDTEKPVRSK